MPPSAPGPTTTDTTIMRNHGGGTIGTEAIEPAATRWTKFTATDVGGRNPPDGKGR